MAEESFEERLARVEGILVQMDKRLNHLESDVAELRRDIARLRDDMNRRFDSMNRRFDSLFKWLIGLMGVMWSTIMATLLPMLFAVLGLI